MVILYLYSELMGYQLPVFRALVERHGAEVHVVHWDQAKLTPYTPPPLEKVTYYKRSQLTRQGLLELAAGLGPSIAYISGWMDKDYLAAARALRKGGTPVVSGFDDIWWGTLRQKAGSLIFPLLYAPCFSHAWVAGPYQYEFAKKLGFVNDHIIFNCLSADLEIFNAAYRECIDGKIRYYPHRFLYAGRFESIKGFDLLLNAWRNIRTHRQDWELCVIGDGALADMARGQADLIVKPFLQPQELAREIAACGCFILPSRFDQWGVVLHEFAAAGLPVVCSNVCGAAPVFVTHHHNGFVFDSKDPGALEASMLRIISLSDKRLIEMSVNSHQCGQRISPEIAAACLVSVLQ